MAEVPSYLDFLPSLWQAGGMLTNVAVVVYDGVAPFELGVLCEAWGTDRSDQGIQTFDFAICAPRPGRVVEMVFFGGMGMADAALVLGVSEKTVKRDWATAKAWLYKEIYGGTNPLGQAK